MATGQVPAEKRIYVHDEGKNSLGVAKSWYRIQPVREWSADEWCDILLRGQYAGATTMTSHGPMPPPPPLPAGQHVPAASSTHEVAGADAQVGVPAAAPLSPSNVPAGWQQYFDPSNGRPYYADARGHTTWGQPRHASEDCAPEERAIGANATTPVPETVDLAQFCEMLTSELVCIWGECHRIAERKRLAKQREEDDEYRKNPPWYARAWSSIKGLAPGSAPANAS